MITVIAVIASLLMTNVDARSTARDTAPQVTGMRLTKVRVGHCVIHGRFARCPVWAWSGDRRRCRYLLHIRDVSERETTTYPTRLECWS